MAKPHHIVIIAALLWFSRMLAHTLCAMTWSLFTRIVKRTLRLFFWLIVLAILITAYLGWRHAELKHYHPSLLLLDRHGDFLAQVQHPSQQGDQQGEANLGYGYWPLKELPPRIVAATLALEDKGFWEHQGVSFGSVLRALWQNVSTGRVVSGASTITMQVARMQNPGGRTYGKKAVEAMTALFLTQKYSRKQILRQYLQLVPYGNQVHGIAHASRYYLDKPVTDLSWSEIAILAAIPQSPSRMNPFKTSGRKRVRKRARFLLKVLHTQQVISLAEYELAKSQVNDIRFAQQNLRPKAAMHAIMQLKERLLSDPQLLEQYPEPRIHTSLDLPMQTDVTQLAKQYLRRFKSRGADNIAIVVTQRDTQEVVAWTGSSDYFSTRHTGAIDYVQRERSLGSTLKPFIYALALERGVITPNTVLDDLHTTSSGVINYDHVFLGPILPRQALANSRNVTAIELLRVTGLKDTYNLLGTMGMHRWRRPANYYGLGLALGSMPSTLEKLLNAYTTLATDGVQRPFVWHKQQQQQQAAGKRIFPEAIARQMTLFLSDPAARLPSFPRMGTTEYPFPVALKTGTSQGYRDTWTIAWSQKYLIGVWIGRPDGRPTKSLTGAGSAGAVAQQVLLHLHTKQLDGLSNHRFQPPNDYDAVRICAHNGKLATPDCPRSYEEWFAPGKAPVNADASVYKVAIDRRTGKPATNETPSKHITVRSYVMLPQEYMRWAAKHDIELPPTAIDIQALGLQGSAARATVKITSPADGQHLIINPDAPREQNTVALRVEVAPEVPQVTWLVNGKPWKVVEHPYTVRWPLQRGKFTFSVELPHRPEKSPQVSIRVH